MLNVALIDIESDMALRRVTRYPFDWRQFPTVGLEEPRRRNKPAGRA